MMSPGVTGIISPTGGLACWQRLAESHHIARQDFFENYQGSELDPRWLDRVSELSGGGLEELRYGGQ
jgi:hypothetical protein